MRSRNTWRRTNGEHHRQSQLLDRPAGRGAEAAARRGHASSASSSRPISRCPAPARRPWTSCGTRPRASSSPTRPSPRSSPSRSPSTSFRISTSSWMTATRKEEWKMMVETKKILDPKIKLTATCVRVPVFVGHSEAVNIEFEKPITAEEAREILREAPGVHGRRQARGRRLRDAGRMRRRFRHLRVAHPRGRDGRERPQSCGSSPTTCARARRSTPCRSPRRSSIAGSCGRQPEGEWPTSSRSRFAAPDFAVRQERTCRACPRLTDCGVELLSTGRHGAGACRGRICGHRNRERHRLPENSAARSRRSSAVHGGLLGIRGDVGHEGEMRRHGIQPMMSWRSRLPLRGGAGARRGGRRARRDDRHWRAGKDQGGGQEQRGGDGDRRSRRLSRGRRGDAPVRRDGFAQPCARRSPPRHLPIQAVMMP